MLWTKSRLWAISSAPVVVCVPCSRRWQTSPLIWLFLQGFPLRLEGQSVSLCRLINVQTQRRHPLFYSAFYPFPLPFHGQLFPLLLWIIMIIICPKLKQCDTPVCQWKYLFGLTHWPSVFYAVKRIWFVSIPRIVMFLRLAVIATSRDLSSVSSQKFCAVLFSNTVCQHKGTCLLNKALCMCWSVRRSMDVRWFP